MIPHRLVQAVESAVDQWRAQNILKYMDKYGFTPGPMVEVQRLLKIQEK